MEDSVEIVIEKLLHVSKDTVLKVIFWRLSLSLIKLCIDMIRCLSWSHSFGNIWPTGKPGPISVEQPVKATLACRIWLMGDQPGPWINEARAKLIIF